MDKVIKYNESTPTRTASGADDITLTFNQFKETPSAGEPESISRMDFPDIDPNLLEEKYRVANTTPAVSQSVLTGNRPMVADVAKPPHSVSAVETDLSVVNAILENSPLEEADLVDMNKNSKPFTPTSQQTSTKSGAKSFWNRLLGR